MTKVCPSHSTTEHYSGEILWCVMLCAVVVCRVATVPFEETLALCDAIMMPYYSFFVVEEAYYAVRY
jgi:hypothetical protein